MGNIALFLFNQFIDCVRLLCITQIYQETLEHISGVFHKLA